MVVMDATDSEQFSSVLRERFPNIRFLSFSHRPRWGVLPLVQDGPPDFPIPYHHSMGAAEEWWYVAWLEPDGWLPRWWGPNEYGVYFIVNEPRLQFAFQRSELRPTPANLVMDHGRVWAYFDRDDAEHKSFLGKVWRLIAKMTSNLVVGEDPQTGESVGPPWRDVVWIGPHAAAWCLADPRRSFDIHRRPPGPEWS